MNFEIDSAYLYNSDGVKLMDVSDAAITTAKVNEEAEKFEKTLYPLNKELEFSATLETTTGVFNELTRRVNPNEFTIKYTKYVQARKHHKKRINKKWLKKYGYKEKILIIDGLNITHKERNGKEDICQYTMTLEKE